MEYGLTSKGFVSKPLSVILEEERSAFKLAFGEDIDISDTAIAGIYIANRAAKIVQLWEILDGLYSAGDVDTASGVYLDRLVDFVNVQREPAISTQVAECLWGTEGTQIYARSLAKLASTGELFRLSGNITIGRNRLLGVWIKVSSVESNAVYSLKIKGVTIEYTATDDDDEASIQGRLAEKIEILMPELFISENLGGDGLKIHVDDGVSPFDFEMADQKMKVRLLGAYGVYVAEVPGPIYAPIGTLTEIVSNVDGLDSIYNYATGITGRVVESDTELRVNLSTRQRQSSSSEAAIKNFIEKEVEGVEYCEVYSNREMIPVNGRPPKCYEAVVVGGADTDIAQTILDKGPGGIQAFGNITMTLIDGAGHEQIVGFSRPLNQYIWFKIGIILTDKEQFPINGIDAIKDNIIAWAIKNSAVGTDVFYQRFDTPIYQVPGISEAIKKIARTTDPSTPPADEDYQEANISIGEVQIAVFDRSRIFAEVIVL
jgi:uncharacterized phage protein gp47/JayE